MRPIRLVPVGLFTIVSCFLRTDLLLPFLFIPLILNIGEGPRLTQQIHQSSVLLKLPLQQKHVHPSVILDLVNELQKLVQSEHRIEEEVEEYAIILAIYSLIDPQVDEPIVVDRLANYHDVLH